MTYGVLCGAPQVLRGCSFTILQLLKEILLIFSERGREGEREGEKHWCEERTLIGCLLYTPGPGTEGTTQAWALTGNQTVDLWLCRMTGQGSVLFFWLLSNSNLHWATYCKFTHSFFCLFKATAESPLVSVIAPFNPAPEFPFVFLLGFLSLTDIFVLFTHCFLVFSLFSEIISGLGFFSFRMRHTFLLLLISWGFFCCCCCCF